MKKHNLRTLQKMKDNQQKIQMLTCYDFQTAQVLSETNLDLILVGDSLGNVVLGYDSTINVSLQEMIIFGSAVKRGAKEKFTIVDLPFGSYSTLEKGLESGIEVFQKTQAEALKLEGANPTNYEIIRRLTQTGIPVMGHIGLMPQSVHAQGGYYKHGKDQKNQERLKTEARALQEAGCFSLVLECVEENLSKEISQELSIPTIGIGSGYDCDGQVLVLNDLLGLTPHHPKFVTPIANFYQDKKNLIEGYLQ